MTQIEVIYDNNIIIGFKMEGHAGYNTKGPDILCASLSAASQMTINGVLDWTGLSLEDIVKKQEARQAILHVHIPSNLHVPTVVQQLLRSFEIFVEQLAEQYKENIKLERRQRDDNSSCRRYAMATYGLGTLQDERAFHLV